MKFASVFCLLVLLSWLLPPETAAQRRLPNGKRITHPTVKAAIPSLALQQDKDTKSSPSTPTSNKTDSSTNTKTGGSTPPPAGAGGATSSGASPAGTSSTSASVSSSGKSDTPRIMLALDAENNVEGKLEFKSDVKPEKKNPPPPCNPAAHDLMERADRAATILREFLDASDRSMPIALLNRSNCIAVIPSMKKGGLSWGGQWGRGVVSCRYENRGWSPPTYFTLTGGSFGLQIGFQLTDLIMIISNRSGVDSLLHDKIEIGASAGATALLTGRSAGVSSDILLDSRIFSYARSRGLFVGLELKSAFVRPDMKANRLIYGDRIHVHDILSSERLTNDVAAACYSSVTVLPRALRDISPGKLYYARVPRPRYLTAPPPSAPAAR